MQKSVWIIWWMFTFYKIITGKDTLSRMMGKMSLKRWNSWVFSTGSMAICLSIIIKFYLNTSLCAFEMPYKLLWLSLWLLPWTLFTVLRFSAVEICVTEATRATVCGAVGWVQWLCPGSRRPESVRTEAPELQEQ